MSQLYGILESFKIYILPTDLAMYQTLVPTLRSLKEAVDIAQESKDDNISKFTTDLDRMLSELFTEVSEIRNSAQDPMVLSASSNNDEVIAYLEQLKDKLKKVEDLKINYESWGSLFKRGGEFLKAAAFQTEEVHVEAVPPSSETVELEETKKELEMKTALWTSLKDWGALTGYMFY
jgi:dynein heavy chain